jgi:parvulin-like peptidyl-prolyl isomerase
MMVISGSLKLGSGEVRTAPRERQAVRPRDVGGAAVKSMRIFICFLMVMTLCLGFGLARAGEPAKVLVKVNDVPITLNEVEDEVTRIVSQTLYHREASPEKREALRKDALEKLIEKELEYQEAKRQGIKADSEKIKESTEEVRGRFPSEKAFNEVLKKNNLTMKQFKERVARELVIDQVFRAEVEEKAKSGDAEIRGHYEKNREQYRELEKIKLRHIVIMFDPSKGAEDKERAGAKAGEMLKRVKAGEDFAALASEYSEDSYKTKGGDLGYVERGRMDAEMEKVAFSLKTGETMGPVETEYGFYLIKVEDKKPERQLSFDEVKERVKKELEAKKKEERKTEWIRSLREKAKIEYR